jgi:MSHA biogenesis protein MshL
VDRVRLRWQSSRPWIVAVLALLVAARSWAQLPTTGQLPPLPLTQLDERTPSADFDGRAFSLTFAQPIPVRELLLLLVRGTNLSIVPDPAISASFIGDLKGVTVRQALDLILPPLGLDYAVDGTFVRVFRKEPETRLYDINYLGLTRTATITSGAAVGTTSGSARVDTVSIGDLFADIAKGVQSLLSDHATFNVDRKAGLLQVTDVPERLDRVAIYLDAVHDRVHRQVQVDARILEVTTDDAEAPPLDVAELIQAGDAAVGGRHRTVGALRPADVTRLMTALAARGKVAVLATPRVVVLNNEPAVVRAVSVASEQGQAESIPDRQEFTLGVTPQIAGDGIVMLSLSPVVTIRGEPTGGKFPSTSLRETDTIARVADGETIVLTGTSRDEVLRERKTTGVKGGWFGRSTVITKKRVELLILLTPTILAPLGTE